jgi:hypothetical protein
VAIGATLAAAGCGGGGSSGSATTSTSAPSAVSETTATTATTVANAPEPPVPGRGRPADPATTRAVDAIAERYMKALVAKDWKAVCATREPSERASMTRDLGSCEAAMHAIFNGKPVSMFADAHAGGVRLRGVYAGVDVYLAGSARPLGEPLGAQHVGDRWYLRDIDSSKVP